MKVSFIATIYNEESTVKRLLESLFNQSRFPDEIIIVDGGSTDNTVSEISNFRFPASNMKAKIKLIFKKGNRSVGRNEAIKKSSGDIIVCSDAGCILDKDWVKNIIDPFKNPKIDVVAGYYQGVAKTVFQKCLIPYILVMPDKVNVGNFLPATRSMAFKKLIWKKAGGFPEQFSNNEDYVFAKKLQKNNARIFFKKEAVVYWIPRGNLKDAFIMFYRFAKGDSESNIIRPKVLLLFGRYIVGFVLLLIYFLSWSKLILNTLLLLLIVYLIWSISKNYKYVKDLKALFYLPIIQIVSDFAVIIGSSIGVFSRHKLS